MCTTVDLEAIFLSLRGLDDNTIMFIGETKETKDQELETLQTLSSTLLQSHLIFKRT